MVDTYAKYDWSGCSSNSDASGGLFHGGKMDPCSFDPCNKMISSRVERARLEMGSFSCCLMAAGDMAWIKGLP